MRVLSAASDRDAPFDLAILDFHMPEMDGEELARRIKANTDFDNVRLMALTSVDASGDARRFREIGVEAYLVKPVRGVMLFETIADVLRENYEGIQDGDEGDAEIQPVFANEQCADRCCILLAEDNEVNQLVVRHMLDPNAYEIVIATDGRAALEVFCATPGKFDLVLMDVSMPEMDGYEATQAIRAYEQETGLNRTPIVCLTAHVMASDIEAAHDAGMDDYLAKPIGKDKLDRAISRWVDGRANDDDIAAAAP